MWELVQETVNYIKNKTNFSPEYGVILGSGLGSFTDDITIEFTLPYNEIPNFPVSTVQGHKGALVFGTIGDKKVMAMQGRFHFYEGYDMKQVTFPVRVMKYLGVTKLIVSNASGGVNSDYEVGSVVIIKDHVNMFPEHPLRGKNDERFGPRFLNMNEAYNKAMIKKAKENYPDYKFDVADALDGNVFEQDSFTHILCMYFTIYYFKDKSVFFNNCFKWLMPGGYLIVHLVDRQHFDPILPPGNPLLYVSPQRYAKKRITSTKVKFTDFAYSADFNLDKTNDTANFIEKFKSDSDGKVRKNELTLYMPDVQQIVDEAQACGFTLESKVDLLQCQYEYQYLYVFVKPN